MFKKRYLKSIALALVATLSLSMFTPSAALAHRYYHHRHGWSSGDTWRAIAGVGVLAYIASRAASSSSSPSYQVMDYETYKAKFIRDMDNAESALWLKIKDLEPGEYYIQYERESTARRIKKFAKNLPYDLEYIGVDDEAKQVYFNKL